MTEHATETAAGAAETKPASGSRVRLVVRIILFSILAYLLCALPYDFLIARKGEDQAWNALQELLENNNTKKGRPNTTNETVQEKLNRQPTNTSRTSDGDTLEVYTWRGGLPWKKYRIYVTYYELRGKLMLSNAYRNESPEQIAAEVMHVDLGAGTPGNPPALTGSPPGAPAGGLTAPGGLGPPAGAGAPPGIGPGGIVPGGGRPSRPDAEGPAEKTDVEESAKKTEVTDATAAEATAKKPNTPAGEGQESGSEPEKSPE